jgi:Ser/Thr protein kinase RdoA (MazF antagonist)
VAEAPRRPELTEPAAPDPGAVAAAFRLPGTPQRLTPVDGAWSNRVYRLQTTAGAYAVKELRNPWGERRFGERLAGAWAFERAAIAAGVAAPEPVPAPDAWPTATVPRAGGGTALVRVHRWADASPVGPGPVSGPVARWAGAALARMHALAVRPPDRGVFPVPDAASAAGWPALVEAAQRAGAPWAAALAAVHGDVDTIARLVREGGHRPDEEVMSHADVDQRNLLLGAAGPLLCDWDVAAPVVPRRELADVALSLAGWSEAAIARTVVTAYAEAGGGVPAFTPADLGAPLAAGLDWIALNAECAFGLRPSTAERRRLATGLLPALLAEVPLRVATALDVARILTV